MTQRISPRNQTGQGGSTLTRTLYRKPPTRLSRTALSRDLGSCVYFIRSGDLIKIGHTSNIAKRKGSGQLSAGWSDILVLWRGTRADEQALHQRFAAHRHHGNEWYHAAQPLIDFINEQRVRMGIPPIEPWSDQRTHTRTCSPSRAACG